MPIWSLDNPAVRHAFHCAIVVFPAPTGQVKFHLGEVCSTARLQIQVDDRTVIDRPLAAGPPGAGPWKNAVRLEQWQVWVSDYDEELSVPVPAGSHRIIARCVEGDWLKITSATFPAYRSSRFPDLHVLGLRSDNLLLAWLHNPQSNWRSDFDGKTPGTLEGLRITVPVPADGQWLVEWWNTSTGEVMQREELQATGGKLTLLPRPFADDVAVRAERSID